MVHLEQLVKKCAVPGVSDRMMLAVIRVESHGDPLAMLDNATGRSYHPRTRATAERILRRLVAAGHLVDVGLAQVDSENFDRYHLTPATAFQPCANIRAGSMILQAGYRAARRAGFGGQKATWHALQSYNSGRLTGDAHYADAVFHQAGLPVQVSRHSMRMRFAHLPASKFRNPFAPFAASWDPDGNPNRSSGWHHSTTITWRAQ